MYRSVCVPAALLVLTLVVPGGLSCPRSCNCYQASEVHCTFRSLLTIPPGLPAHTQRINLGFNSISRIHDSSLAGLKKVELLMLHSNDIHHLPDAVFKDMKSLQILKLSYNKLSEISSSLTFSGLTSLLRLYLDHNLLQHIHPRALLQLPSLRLLRLQGNRLHQLHPHTLCTLSLLNTYYFSTLRHLDLSNNSLTTLPKDTLATAPLLETLVLQANPWSCDCRMSWFLSWSLAHPGLMKCPGGPQCPTCTSPNSLQGQGLLDQTDLSCASPVILSPGRKTPLETEHGEIQSRETFREPLGSASVGLSDLQGNSVDLSCNVTHSFDSQDIAPPPDLSLSSSSPIPLALSLSLECPVDRESYEQLWRILAYYSETAVRLEREIMLGKAPALAYRYRQAAETDGYYHTGVKASVKVRPQWLLQPAISIQLNRAQSNGNKVHLIYSTRVSAHPGPTSYPSTSSPASHPWVLISTSQSTTAMAAVSGSKVELSCPHLSSGNAKVQWILPDGSKLNSPSSSPDGRLRATASGLLLQKVQLSNAGLYYCVAQAGRDVDVLPVRLAVEESSVPPSGEEVGPPVTGGVREPISLSCKASGSPEPHISWVLPDGNIIRSGLFVSGGLTLTPNGSLSLSNPSLRDAGHYRCIAVNHYGSDSLSVQLELKPQHPPPLRTLFPRGPQSAAGLSTKIRAPLLRQMEEGSGDEEEGEERTLFGNRRRPGLRQPLPNRRYPNGNPRRRGPVREGPLRRGGGPVSSTDQRRNRFENRHRVTTNKQRIDPEKWAHLLAKIRQKTSNTNNSQPITAGSPTAEPVGRGRDGDAAREEQVDDTERESASASATSSTSLSPSHKETHIDTMTHSADIPDTAESDRSSAATPASTQSNVVISQTHVPDTHTKTHGIQTQTKTGTATGKDVDRPLSRHSEEQDRNLPGVPYEPHSTALPSTHTSVIPSTVSSAATATTAPVVRSRPRIADPHIRTVSFPAESTARLACEAQGEPKPSITWTKVATGAVMSFHSKAQRFEVLPNGTLVIQNVQLQDRGTYICSAQSFLGRDRLLTTLEVWTRPPRMQLPSYREDTIHQGGELLLQCQADGVPAPLLSWVLPDRSALTSAAPSADRIFMDTNGTLHISVTLPSDRGMYRCVASNSAGAASASVRVHVSSLPPVIQQPREEHLLLSPGRPVYAHCSARGAPPPTLRWRIPDGTLVRPSQFLHGNLFVLPNGTLHIRRAGPKDSGSYECTASNAVGADKRTVRVEIEGGASKARIVSTSPSVTTVRYGGILQLHCSVTGNPTPIIIWRTPTRKLVDMHFSFDRRLKVHPNGTLSAQAVTEKDAGDYLCIARNKVADDYRLLRVSVTTKPAKIEPKQPLNQMVSLGKPLKVDCQASGLPDPAVHWSLPDGTMVNSVLQGEDRGGRARRLTVFDNGTLLVPAVGMGEEGEYTCYAENQGGQDTMKVKVKVMMTSPPTFTDDRSYRVIKIRQGATATIHCRAAGDPAPTVTWFSPARRVIPRSLGSGYYSERVVVVSGGTLEVRLAQKIDTGNYTCRASNSAGERSMAVGLEVETPNHGVSGQVGGRSTSNGSGGSRLGDNMNNAGIVQYGFINGASSKLGSNNSSSNGYSDNNGRIRNIEPNTGIHTATSASNPALRSESRNGFNRPVSGITTQLGRSVISVGVSGVSNIGFKADNTGINRNGPGIVSSSSNSVANSHSTGASVGKISGTNNNEVIAGRASNDANTSRDNGRISGTSRNVGVSSSVSNSGAGTGNWFPRSGVNVAVPNDDRRSSGGIAVSNTGTKNSTNTFVGVVTTVKQRAVKGRTVLLPCPSQGSPPPRLAWLLPGNGVLPAPYYGSRLTVHRNGSLELRGVRASDAGTLVCVVRGERGETRIQVELEVSEAQEEARSPHRGTALERPEQKNAGASAKSFSSVLPEKLHPRIPVTQKPLQRGLSLPAPPRPVGPQPHSAGTVSEPAVSTRTASLVSIINGETLRLPCPAPQTGYTQGSLSWTMPSGKVLSRGESGDSERISVQEDGTLKVQQASVFDRGTYTCRSTSYDSTSVSVITVPVIVIAYPPRITTGPSPVTYTRPGVAVELPCLTIATPRATVTWETPDLTQLKVMGQARIYGNRYLSPQGSLVIQNPTSRDTGFYRCTAKNVIGVDTKATYLHVI
ncbi:matrix-remodeling-associated protein 5-like [Seriola dumerili]|uniref:matrix-remodeling-associated protein 5-like n=1 Tax=Seriola dumerili TaxID=41447 RepID=UPI000BBE6691|nr:matrix-remodeling-associated protein 5-like [Seriola dumerili]